MVIQDPIEIGMNDDFIEYNDLNKYEIGLSRLFKTDFTLVDRANKMLKEEKTKDGLYSSKQKYQSLIYEDY